MKKAIAFLVLIIVCLELSGCLTTLSNKRLPPGQEKKISGSKNAKDNAPGRNK